MNGKITTRKTKDGQPNLHMLMNRLFLLSLQESIAVTVTLSLINTP